MARIHGRDTDVAFDSVQMEDWVDNVTLNFTVPEADITAFSDAYQNALAGKPGATLDLSGSFDAAALGPDATIFGELGEAAKAYDFEPGGGVGYDGFAIVTGYSITASVGDAVKFSASLKHNGKSAAADGLAPTRA